MLKNNKKIALVGSGSWAKRLKEIFSCYDIEMIDPRGDYLRYNSDVKEVWICVPSHCFIEVVNCLEINMADTIVSCCKGLLRTGQSPIEFLHEKFPECEIKHLGGPNIDDGNELIRFGGKKLETSSILKNVYAIGFAMAMEQFGVNVAAKELLKYQAEMKKGGCEHFEDLIATCFSSKSRNYQFGISLITGEKIDDDIVVEGFETAKVMKTKKDVGIYTELSKIIDIIFINYKIVYGEHGYEEW